MRKFLQKAVLSGYLEHALFLVLLVFASIFYEERLLADSSYYLFRVINNGSFWVEHGRFILIFSQILPLAGVNLGLGLKTLVILYSLGNVLFFYAVFVVCRYAFKDKYAGFAVILFQTLGLVSGFFVPMFELYYCAGLLVLFAVVLFSNKKNPAVFITLFILAFFILTSHTLAYVLFFFVLAIHFLQYKTRYLYYYIGFGLLFVAVFIFKKYAATEYEQGKTQVFFNNLKDGVYDFQYIGLLWNYMFETHKALLLLMTIVIVTLFVSGKYLPGMLYVATFAGLLIIMNLLAYGFVQSRYQEQVYFPLSFITAYMFSYFVLKNSKELLRYAWLAIFVLVVIWKLALIYEDGKAFHHRLAALKSLINHTQTLEGSKFVVNETNMKHEKSVSPNWSFPIETMLISGYSSPKMVTICTDEDINYQDNLIRLNPGNYMFRRYEIFDLEWLNPTYFRLDKGNYEYLNKDKLISDSVALEKVTIEVAAESLTVKTDAFFFLSVSLQNVGDTVIFSNLKNGIFLNYYYEKEGTIINREELKTPLQVDIISEYSQEMILRSPEMPGKYELTITLDKNGREIGRATRKKEVRVK